ncbi:L,D-transpeptidase family protein [Halomonas shantousis]
MNLRQQLLSLCILLFLGMTAWPASADQGEVWLLVDDKTSTLHVYRGEKEIEHFHPVSLGRGGASRLRVRGDNKTPTGEFRINWINRDSRFHIFLGLDYPTLANAREAQNAGIMSNEEFDRYLSDYRRLGVPPQNTVLGGNIGIHGIGEGDPSFHKKFNWTQGCVAVTNEQIEQLADWVGLGTRVIIR